jgi:hypothetical protein
MLGQTLALALINLLLEKIAEEQMGWPDAGLIHAILMIHCHYGCNPIGYGQISQKPCLFIYFYLDSNSNTNIFRYKYRNKCCRMQIQIVACRIWN